MNALSSKAIFRCALITILFTIGVIGWAQSSPTDDDLAKETQARGYWADPLTGLVWAAKDNGKSVSWHKATKYCRSLRLAGYSDWRLATIDELESLVNLEAYATEHLGTSDILHWNVDLHVKGGLLLTGDRQWSITTVDDPNPQVSKTHFWAFDYRIGRRQRGFEDWAEGDRMQALCVRRAPSAPSAPLHR